MKNRNIIALLGVTLINFLTMPADLQVGDPLAIRKEAVHWINSGRLGIPVAEKDLLGELSAVDGQYFVENPIKGRLYSKYGPLNTILYCPPLLVEKIFVGKLDFSATPPLRFFLINLYNILLSVLLAFALLKMAGLFAPSSTRAAIFLAACFYCTFLWNYLRSQGSEIFQVLFFTVFYYAAVQSFRILRSMDKKDNWGWIYLAGAVVAAGCLALLKFYYVAIFPILAAVFYRALPQNRKRVLTTIAAAALAVLVLMAWSNAVRFSSPLDFGYSHWKVDGAPFDRWSVSSIGAALLGFLLSPHWSLFLHFPPLIAATLYGRAFFRRYPVESILLFFIAGVFLLAIAGFSHWDGQGYGPRYLLFVLPALSLPALLADPRALFRKAGHYPAKGLAIAVLAAHLWSLQMQLNVNALPFLFYYRIQGPFAIYKNPRIDAYFRRTPFGKVNGDLLEGADNFYPFTCLQTELAGENPAEVERVRTGLTKLSQQRNYFFRMPRFRRKGSAAPADAAAIG